MLPGLNKLVVIRQIASAMTQHTQGFIHPGNQGPGLTASEELQLYLNISCGDRLHTKTQFRQVGRLPGKAIVTFSQHLQGLGNIDKILIRIPAPTHTIDV